MGLNPSTSLNVTQFLTWAARQGEGKYELINGAVIKEPPQNWGHTKTRMQAWFAFNKAIATATLPFFVAPNGPTVRIDERTAFLPDALVAPLPEPAPDSLEVDNPIIVVEVLSPSTARMDTTTKLRGYFKVPSVRHYLIVDPEKRTVTHHKRVGDTIKTRTVRKGALKLASPGLDLPLIDVFGPAQPTSHA